MCFLHVITFVPPNNPINYTEKLFFAYYKGKVLKVNMICQKSLLGSDK